MKPLITFAPGLRGKPSPQHSRPGRVQLRGSGWFIIVTLVLSTLACGLFDRNAGPVARLTITRLPTLTRTPLPTLTPTPSLNPAAGAGQAIVPVEDAPSPKVTLLSALPATLVPIGDEASNQAVAGDAGTNPDLPSPPPATLAPSLSPTTISTSLPTETPTPVTTAMPVSPPGTTPAALPTETALPGATPTAVASPGSPVDTPGWSLNGAQLYPSLYVDGLMLYGNVTNNTGSAQALALVTATFLDAQGQLIAAGDNVIDYYWPTDIVPAGGTVPFELMVEGIQNAADFDLIVESEPSGDSPRQDFEFFDLNQSTEDGVYCLEGSLRNPGGNLDDYLTVAAVLYDDQNRVVNFSDYYEAYPEEIKGDQTLEFNLCMDLEGQNVARHELLAWGE